MTAKHVCTARVSDELHVVGVTFADRDSWSRSVDPRAKRAANETVARHLAGWAYVGVDFNRSRDLSDGVTLAYAYVVRGGLRREWESSDDHGAMLGKLSALRAEWDAAHGGEYGRGFVSGQHGYGDATDCLCGRNFGTVRGLREHLTKSRLAAT